ncbi:hypothetical protein BpHYR1_029827 [Brachionus plicatilis]|uniref:Uncharacterized protein n=1 Tax=Brachionus plicatilis TaxID=10195 RepID=A0A3M7S9B1_BRAPC|nr:hypothetical protein BpHYR1_029827 [Brachionus plicatilis]
MKGNETLSIELNVLCSSFFDQRFEWELFEKFLIIQANKIVTYSLLLALFRLKKFFSLFLYDFSKQSIFGNRLNI